MNCFDAIHRQDFAGRLLGELVRTVAGSDGNGQGVDAGLCDETLGFVGIGQQLIVGQLADRTVTIFLFAFARFERAEATEFAFDADALRA